MKKRLPLIFGLLLVMIGIGILVYPSFVLCINEHFSTSAINTYSETVNTLSDKQIEEYIGEAEKYNDKLKEAGLDFNYSTESAVEGYENILSFQDGIVGYIQIPVIDVNLPIYHGSDETCLSKGVAHLPNTAFPVGGYGNHCVLAAHTAYADQIFFDYIHELRPGDKIYIIILNKTYLYKVVETNIVLPNDSSPCSVVPGKDLLSLVTCHPYAQNTHRLIVKAERVETIDQADEEGVTLNTIDIEELVGKNEEELVIQEEDIKTNDGLNTHEIIVLAYIIFVIISILVILIVIILTIIKKIQNKIKEKRSL